MKRSRAALGVLAAVLLCAGLTAGQAQAQEANLAFAQASGLSTQPLSLIVARIIRGVIGVTGIVLVVLLIYAGFRYMTAAGDPKKVEAAKSTIIQAVVGLAIILLSYAIASFVINMLARALGAGGIVARDASAFIEPLSGSLGAGIVQDHYPPRNALDIPRNVRVFVTFKEPIAADSVPGRVLIYPTAACASARPLTSCADILPQDQLAITFDAEARTFVFDPVPLLGSPTEDTNYTVMLQPTIKLANGRDAFTGTNNQGYAWTFEVSTEVDLTPPKVVSVSPVGGTRSPNTAVQITFNEPMDPVSSTGTLGAGGSFGHLEVLKGDATPVNGDYRIGNGYRTVEFVPDVACARDQCGDTVFCLPFNEDLHLLAHAATLSTEPPQARLFGASFDGLTDASGNSLDGNDDDIAQGKGADDFASDPFHTGSAIDARTPEIGTISPNVEEGDVEVDRPVTITFTMGMLVTTLNGSNVQLFPDPSYPMSFVPRSENLGAGGIPAIGDDEVEATRVSISHPTFLPPDVDCDEDTAGIQACNYYPLVTKGVKGGNQFCLYPSFGPDNADPAGRCAVTQTEPFCCHGRPSSTACTTLPSPGRTLPPAP